jgi:signal transduction histidine kinase
VPDQIQVWGDAIRLQQVVTNLLSNALKYSPPGSPIEVTAETVSLTSPVDEWVRSQQNPDPTAPSAGAEHTIKKVSSGSAGKGSLPRIGDSRSTQMVRLTVRDYGQGIPPDQVSLLFNRFVRLPRDLASSISGNGLGLYLCRLYVEAMRGRIWVTSSGQPGDGSAFEVLLPAAATRIDQDMLAASPVSGAR